VGKTDLRAQRFEPFQVLVDRADADGAAAGERHPGVAEAGEERPEHEDARAHRLHQVVGSVVLRRRPVAAEDQGAVRLLGGDPQMVEELLEGADVAHPGHAVERQRPLGQQARGERRERRVLGAARFDAASQARGADDVELFHEIAFQITSVRSPAPQHEDPGDSRVVFPDAGEDEP
jgi:hypothetical protein